MTTPSYTPMCPVCHIPLTGVGFPLPTTGVGRCPNGGLYAYKVDVDELETKKDKFGNPMRDMKWNVAEIPDEEKDAPLRSWESEEGREKGVRLIGRSKVGDLDD